jgi:hypothetical protein
VVVLHDMRLVVLVLLYNINELQDAAVHYRQLQDAIIVNVMILTTVICIGLDIIYPSFGYLFYFSI